MTDLRAYMVFNRQGGSEEGAVLVFARTAREARRLGWPWIYEWADKWIDVAARWLRSGCPHLRRKEEPHVVPSPPLCLGCELWDEDPLNRAGYCVSCAAEYGPAEGLA